MPSKHLYKVARLLAFALRHKPTAIGLTLDSEGWTPVDDLLAKLPPNRKVTRAQLEEIVATDDKNRYSFNEDGTKIRANQGHTAEVHMTFSELAPPAKLYHGTVERFWPAIEQQGLIKGSRHHVHLSEDMQTAEDVGARRKGSLVLLEVDTAGMAAAGFKFFQSENGVWLTDSVPAKYLSRCALSDSEQSNPK